MIELRFKVTGKTIPADHGYVLYSSLSRLLSEVHRENGIAIQPIRGQQAGDRQLQLCDWSRLVVRAAAEQIPALVQLSGKQLNLAGSLIRIGVPQVFSLTPTPALRSRLVTIKLDQERNGPFTSERFAEAARKQLDTLSISREAFLSIGRRRTLRIKDKEVIGFETIIQRLTADESIALQERGLGGRRHMGCGVFVVFVKRDGGSRTWAHERGLPIAPTQSIDYDPLRGAAWRK